MGLSGIEPETSRLSGARSNRLSYKPMRSALQGRDVHERTNSPLLFQIAILIIHRKKRGVKLICKKWSNFYFPLARCVKKRSVIRCDAAA